MKYSAIILFCGVMCGSLLSCSGLEEKRVGASNLEGEMLTLNKIVEIRSVGDFSEKFPARLFNHNQVKLEKSILVPMRDGVRLSTDIYAPAGMAETLPVILIRTPYNKNFFRSIEQPDSIVGFFVAHGYVVVVQDVRGRFESEGEFTVSAADRADGYDMVDWLSRQPWSNTKVGTYGCSYLGENQIQLAAERHPNHLAAIPQAAAGSYRGNFRQFGYFDGGVFDLKSGLPWFWLAGSKINAGRPKGLSDIEIRGQSGRFEFPKPEPLDTEEAFRHLPVVDIIKHYKGPQTDFEDFISLSPADSRWDRYSYVDDQDKFNVPALHVNSWYDYGPTDTLALFNLLRANGVSKRARENQFVMISPFGHCGSESQMAEKSKIGNRELGDTRFDYYSTYLDWFDYWLKGVENGITGMPKVQYFLMGANKWRSASKWPLENTQFIKFYLHSDGSANSSMESGVLDMGQLKDSAKFDRYVYNPDFPVPTQESSYDQRDVELRNDVLVYSTAPLKNALEVTGPLKAVLYVSSSAKDTDFTVKLVDVYPNGTAFNVQEAILRARYREGYDKEVFMEQNGVYKLTIDLHDTSNLFAAGHRIRLEVSSSNFPRFVRNLNTGGNNYDENQWIVAENTVHHSEQYPSHLVLPVQHKK